MLNGKQRHGKAMVFSYYIVPSGGEIGQTLIRGALYTHDVAAAKQHAETVSAPGVVATAGFEVILHDATGAEIWRGPYRGDQRVIARDETSSDKSA